MLFCGMSAHSCQVTDVKEAIPPVSPTRSRVRTPTEKARLIEAKKTQVDIVISSDDETLANKKAYVRDKVRNLVKSFIDDEASEDEASEDEASEEEKVDIDDG